MELAPEGKGFADFYNALIETGRAEPD
jgi:hypothetical protein